MCVCELNCRTIESRGQHSFNVACYLFILDRLIIHTRIMYIIIITGQRIETIVGTKTMAKLV